MKKILITIAFLLAITICGKAQENSSDTSKIANRNTKVEEPKSSVHVNGKAFNFIFDWGKKSKTAYQPESHWTGFGVSLSYLSNLGDVSLSRSYSIYLNLLEFGIPVGKNIMFGTGLGFDWQHYSFRRNVVLKTDSEGFTGFFHDTREHAKNRFNLYHLVVPFIFEYQTRIKAMPNWNNEFFVQAGIEALVKTSSQSYAKVKTNGGVEKEKYSGLNISPLTFRFILKAGFERFSIFGYYQPISIFEKDKGIDIKPYGIGLMLNFN
jgi:hypothetical protein